MQKTKEVVVMGIYLGQLPPAELARLKAELAETLIANFCYPRFFDYRTQSLRMRPVDRAKRQEVWLYLSSVDFTTWNRVDVMSPDFQRQLERLFIQFVQRNRSFFAEQGRRRMSDIRMLIGSSASTVTQGLRSHIAGQRPAGVAAFGSPRPVVSWSTKSAQSPSDLSWEQIANATMLLQQQLQEARAGEDGEIKTSLPNDGRAAILTAEPPTANGASRRVVRPQAGAKQEPSGTSAASATPAAASVTPTTPANRTPAQGATRPSTPLSNTKTPAPSQPQPTPSRSTAPAASTAPVQKQAEASVAVGATKATNSGPATPVQASQVAQKTTARPTPQITPIEQASTAVSPVAKPATPREAQVQAQSPLSKVAPAAPSPATTSAPPPTPVTPLSAPTPARSIVAPVPVVSTSVAPTSRDNPLMRVGDDDIAIFEQMRHQMIVWLRIEVVRLGLDLASQTPSQLLELLRQQDHMDETRLQVVSTLLNLANQVITNGQVSVLDYKQALMFHLMHTRR